MKVFDIANYLDSEEMIEAYLQACFEEDDPALSLSALGDAIRAIGIHQFSKRAHLSEKRLLKILAPGSKPRYETVFKIMKALNIPLIGSAHRTTSTT